MHLAKLRKLESHILNQSSFARKSIKDPEGVICSTKWMRNLDLCLDEVRSIHVPLDHHSDFYSPGVEPVMKKRVCSPRYHLTLT